MHTLLTTGAMLFAVVAGAAQAPGPSPAVFVREIQSAPFPDPVRSRTVMTERLLSLDVNADGRVSADELPERMQKLMTDGDKNADATLDASEIHTLVNAASSERTRAALRSQTSEGLPGVISDLKLSPEKHQRALAIVSGHVPFRAANDPANSVFLAEMKTLLDDEEYENFVAAATRLTRTDIRFRTVGGVVSVLKSVQAP
jgi:hypothetical protein